MPVPASSLALRSAPNGNRKPFKPAPWPHVPGAVFSFYMPNILHTFLAAGFVQATPHLGESVKVGRVTATAFVTPADEKIAMEMTGYMDELAFIIVVNLADWASDI